MQSRLPAYASCLLIVPYSQLQINELVNKAMNEWVNKEKDEWIRG